MSKPDILRDKMATHTPTKLPPTFNFEGNQICTFLKSNNRDQITPLIRAAAEKYRLSTFNSFDLNLSIRSQNEEVTKAKSKLKLYLHPPTFVPSIRDSNNKFLGWQFYFFDIHGVPDEPTYHEVRLLGPPESHPDRPPSVRVRYGTRWLSIPHFLEIYPAAIRLRAWTLQQTKQSLYDSQWRWWVTLSRLPPKQRKFFRLLELPAELREQIYANIFPSPHHPFPKNRSRRLSGTEFSAFVKTVQSVTGFMKLNRQIYNETSKVLFSDTDWFIPHLPILDKILIKPALCARVQRLHLELSHEAFFKLFTKDEFSRASLQPLRTMKLRSLVLDIASPPFWKDETRGPACQKLIVGWILKAAEEWVVGHEGVRVVGWVKEKQRREFEGLCKQKLREFRWWKEVEKVGWFGLVEWDAFRREWEAAEVEDGDGGVSVVEEVEEGEKGNGGEDGGEWKDERALTTYMSGAGHLPPECFCKVSCGLEGWSAEE